MFSLLWVPWSTYWTDDATCFTCGEMHSSEEFRPPCTSSPRFAWHVSSNTPWNEHISWKIDGWKMTHFLLKWSLFRGHSFIFWVVHLLHVSDSNCTNIPYRIHVWYIYLHLIDLYGKCRYIHLPVPLIHPWFFQRLCCWMFGPKRPLTRSICPALCISIPAAYNVLLCWVLD